MAIAYTSCMRSFPPWNEHMGIRFTGTMLVAYFANLIRYDCNTNDHARARAESQHATSELADMYLFYTSSSLDDWKIGVGCHVMSFTQEHLLRKQHKWSCSLQLRQMIHTRFPFVS
jgi:hypothetical protein